MIQHWIMLIYSLFNLGDDSIQEFDARWDDVLLSTSKIPSDDILESLYKLRIRESEKLKTVLELYDIEIHQKISMPKNQNLTTMVKRSIKVSVRKETNVVSGMRVTIARKNQNTKPPHLSSPRCHEVEVCRRNEVSEAEVTMVPFFDNCADTI